MTKKFEKLLHYFKKMSPLKKVLIVFVVLLIFIIVVKQPGSDSSKRRESARFFIPKLVIADVHEIQVSNLSQEKEVILEKKEGEWRVANGHFFPADSEKVDNFLKAMHALKEKSLVSKNPERMAIFSVDEKNGTHIQVWNKKEHAIADFYVGETIPDGQYIRRADESEVFQTTPTLLPFLIEDVDGWKDKTLLSVNEKNVRRIVLKNPKEEMALEKKGEDWRVVQPEDYEAEPLAVRTLFEQLGKVQADSFADSVEGSQADFEQADYKLSVRLTDDSLKLVLFSGPNEGGQYFAKNPESNFIYSVSQPLIDNIFGLEFKAEAAQ